MAQKLNDRVIRVLNVLATIKPQGDMTNLTITSHDNCFQLFFKGEQIDEDLTLTDLKNISKNALKVNAVHLVDVSQLISNGQVKSTDAYLKVEDDIAKAFIHVIHNMKFQKSSLIVTPKAEIAI